MSDKTLALSKKEIIETLQGEIDELAFTIYQKEEIIRYLQEK